MNAVVVLRAAAGILLLSMTLVGAFKCPDNCECTPVQRGQLIHNHVKCTSLDGLRSLGKSTEIQSLDLSVLNITKVADQLDKLSSLHKLDLSHNLLAEVNSLTNKHIRTLNLAHNRITSGKLIMLPLHVKHLDLSANDITDLPLDFKRLVNLKSLELSGNPLNCSCETLEVRNWLQEKLVWTDHPVTCASPEEFKDKSWLQVRQALVCEHKNGEQSEPHILPYAGADNGDDENDLMLGDDPSVLDESGEDEELGKDFLPVGEKHAEKNHSGDDEYSDDGSNEVEGSGATETTTHSGDFPLAEEVYEGSGDEVTEIINAVRFHVDEAAIEKNDTSIEEEDDGSGGASRTLFDHSFVPNITDTSSEEDLSNATIIAVNEHVHRFNESVSEEANPQLGNIALDTVKNKEDETKESKSTYILLTILLVLLVVLIAYVALKRSRKPTKIPVDDRQSGAREMLPVNKKPVTQNGSPEIIPLIGTNGRPATNEDKGLNDLEGPLLEKLNEAEAEVDSPVSDVKYENELPEANGQKPPNNDFQPVSPKPSRYSPVSTYISRLCLEPIFCRNSGCGTSFNSNRSFLTFFFVTS